MTLALWLKFNQYTNTWCYAVYLERTYQVLLVTIPIQIFNAIESGNDICFKQINKNTNNRNSYKKVDAVTDDDVPYADIVKGYEYEPDQYVILSPEELNNIKLASTRAIDIEAFVDDEEVSPSLYEAVYFVAPNGDIAQSTFNLLVQTLSQTKKSGIGRIILRDREDVVLLTPEGKGLIMYKLRYPYEVRSIDDVPGLKEVPIDQAQLDWAKTLVSSLQKPFDKVDFEDRYRAAMLELVNDKIAGKQTISIIEEETSAPVVDIMDALKKSIEAAKKTG